MPNSFNFEMAVHESSSTFIFKKENLQLFGGSRLFSVTSRHL
jgi:hypothetical protein